MSKLQNNLSILQNTIDELANIINDSSVSSGGPELITKCTSFSDYPELLRSVINSSSSGLATVFAYKISDVNPGIPDDIGDFDFDTNTYTPPKNWSSANDLNASDTDTV